MHVFNIIVYICSDIIIHMFVYVCFLHVQLCNDMCVSNMQLYVSLCVCPRDEQISNMFPVKFQLVLF